MSGLLDISPLRAITIKVVRKGPKVNGKRHSVRLMVDLVEATDAEFQAWAAEQLRATFAEHRLVYRLAVLEAMFRRVAK